jgi:hypothetical protein
MIFSILMFKKRDHLSRCPVVCARNVKKTNWYLILEKLRDLFFSCELNRASDVLHRLTHSFIYSIFYIQKIHTSFYFSKNSIVTKTFLLKYLNKFCNFPKFCIEKNFKLIRYYHRLKNKICHFPFIITYA